MERSIQNSEKMILRRTTCLPDHASPSSSPTSKPENTSKRLAYAETAFMKENGGEPRVGRENLIQHERAALARRAQIRTERVGPVLVDGDRVTINWVFEIATRDGKNCRLDELALQKWSGERIVEEQF